MIVKLSAAAWGALQIVTGVVRGGFALGVVRTARGLSDSTRQSVYLPILSDAYPPDGRNRVFGAYYAIATAGTIAGPAFIGLLSGVWGLSFRVVFPITGVLTFGVAAAALRLHDPGYGRYDTDRIRERVGGRVTGEEAATALRWSEAFRRLTSIGTLYRILVGMAVVGVGLVASNTFLPLFLEQEYGLDSFGRGVVLSVLGVAAAVGYVVGGKYGERLFRRSPKLVLQVLGGLLGAYGLMLAVAVWQPDVELFTLAQVAATAAVTAVLPATFNVLTAIVPPRLRGYSFAVQGIYIGFFGGLVGSVVIGSIADKAGYKIALALVLVPSAVGGWIMARAGDTFESDLDQLTDELIEDQQVAALRERGRRLPLLEVRGVDFAYDGVQVLFGVDFTVDEGQIVALLGTNGAGKSTLLSVISGLGVPSRGTVRLRGADITYLNPERRVRLGIAQVPGGRAVFPSLSVLENLRMAAFSVDDADEIERGIARVLDTFPILAERRHQAAGTLSGGEQQMLGLGKALILRPQLLLVDELSLGLAPKIVAQLLDVVRAVRAGGTTVVLVEQSVNVALRVADEAYFMEKGEIRFHGRADELLERDDLLRSVFLEGASRTLSARRR
jgi:ABC-type branched-subunit amino acid transport system ATPase component/predicted MFS family arabinose efflux permease